MSNTVYWLYLKSKKKKKRNKDSCLTDQWVRELSQLKTTNEEKQQLELDMEQQTGSK